MKKITLYSIAFAMFFVLHSCSKDDSSAENTENSIKQGSWVITLFNDSGKDETYHFTGYEFTFATSGVVTAVSSSNTVSGTWSTSSGSSSSSSGKFIIDFGDIDKFDDLNDDWDILNNTSSKIELKDVSGGNGGIDYLTFEKK